LPVSAALCVDGQAIDRLGPVLRHLVVGLVDQAVQVRLVSSDPRIESLALGPIQSLVHQPIEWPAAARRTGQVIAALAHQPPMVVEAMSMGSFRPASAMAEAFDADLIVQVTSLDDCDMIAQLENVRIGRFHAISRPLATVLETQLKIDPQRIDVIHPGVRAAQQIACFGRPDRVPTILCLSPFEKGAGIGRLIRTIEVLRRRKHEVVVFLLGAGRYETSLRRLARDRHLSECITFVQPPADVSQAIAGADIFVHPSEDTFFSAHGLQAMGIGVAVVTLASSACDHYRHGETAVVCERPTPESLADGIESLLNNHEHARHIATTAQEHVRTRHAMSGMAERTTAAYRRLALRHATFPIKE